MESRTRATVSFMASVIAPTACDQTTAGLAAEDRRSRNNRLVRIFDLNGF
jgi:hypothetical protein